MISLIRKRNGGPMKKSILSIAGIFLITSLFFAGVINEDKPIQGKWDFKMVKLWEVDKAGEDYFVSMSVYSDEDGKVFITDSKNFKTYVFDKSGKFLLSFGERGEGPGEMKQFGSLYIVNDKLIYYENHKVHYFSKEGTYHESANIPQDLVPRAFIDEESLISAPRMNWRDPKGEAECVIYDIKDKSKTLLFEYSTYKKGVARRTSGRSRSSFSFSSSDITPLMITAYRDNKIYYGINNEYKITVRDLKTGKEFDFGLKREKQAVPKEFKDDLLKGINFPADVKKQIKDGLPDHFTFFEGMLIDGKGNIYVFVTDALAENRRKIDIFSPDGKYIYSAEVRVEKDLIIRSSDYNNDKLYLGIEDEAENMKLVKYKIAVPEISLNK